MLTIGPLLVVMAAPGVTAEEPWVEVSIYEGSVGSAAAWEVAPPETGCIIVEDTPSPLIPKTCGGIRFGGENGEVATNATEGVKTIVAELDWDNNLPGTTLQFDTFCDEVPRGASGSVLDPNHPCYHNVQGTGPLQIRIDAVELEGGEYDPVGAWASRVFASAGIGVDEAGVGVGAAYEQPFTIYVSMFYGEEAPEGYSAIP